MLRLVASAALLLCSVASHSGGHAAALTLPARHPLTDADVERLAQSVAKHLTGADFDEPAGNRLRLSVRADLLFVKGVVNRRSARRVHKALLSAPDVGAVVLTLVPGSAHDPTNLQLGLMLRQANYTTYLPSGGLVASGGTDLLLAGVLRIVERGARIGVHSWSDGSATGDTIAREAEAHRIYLDYYRALAIDQEFYWFTLQAAPADRVHWMNDSEMTMYSVYTHLR
ncbi:MAG: alpha/beta hydrolase [Deltaproteobacteria bacterium]|nr:alpha/beta hydrolase [Deltaproteobacteria bacterium]